MKTTLSSRRDRYLVKFSIFLITVALIAGMVGCRDHIGKDLYIETWYDLDLVRENLDNKHHLMNDLDADTPGYTDLVSLGANGEKGWEPIGNSIAPFKGSFDGQGHKIRDLFINRPNEDYVGLFSSIAEGGVIKNVNVVDVTVIGDWRVGGLVGENQFEGTVSNSFSSGSVTGDKYVGGLVGVNEGDVIDSRFIMGNVISEGGSYIGGLVGKNDGGTVSDSDSAGSVTGDKNVGGLVGFNDGGNLSDSHFTGNVTSKEGSYIGGLVGFNDGGNVSDSHSAGSVTGESYVGGLVGFNDGGNVSDSHSTGSVTGENGVGVGGLVGKNQFEGTVSNSYSTGSVTGENGVGVGGLVGENQFEGTVSNSYSTGSVTGENGVGVGGLVGNNYKGTVSNSHYNCDEVLINGQNIITIGALFNEDNEDFDQWLANGKFLDVNKRLSEENGYYLVNNVTDFQQLLAFGQNGSLKFRLKNDLDLGNDPNFHIPYFAGEFDGNGHKISNLSFNFDFVHNVGLFGCLAPGGRVTQVSVENVKITGANFVGGLVGNNWEGTVRDSYSTGSVSGKNDVGGLVGSNDAGNVEENCNSTCSVTGNRHVGGLVGCNYEEGTVRHSYSTGSVSGNRRVGGLVGCNLGTVEKSNSTGSVSGGVLYILGDVVGGLVGWNEAIVSESYSTGSVSGDNHVGGLVGWNDKTVSKSYSTGRVSGDHHVGGLVGINDVEGTVNRTYSTGRVTSVTGDEYVGGLVGENYGDVSRISRSFWDTETSGQDTSYGGTGKTTEEMQDIATFTAWSIIAVTSGQTNPSYTWNIVNGVTYPFLSWES